MLEFSLMG